LKDCSNKFEGPEKKIEIILSSSQTRLRHHHDDGWKRVVEASRSTVLSRIRSTQMDAYLLSESSLFLWDDRILMITCGKTTLVDTVPEILKIVDRDRIAFFFYERKSFMFPKEQPSNFEEDVAKLLKDFTGKSYRLGPANDDHVHVFYASKTDASSDRDSTLQVLMHDLDPEVMEIFVLENSKTTEEIEKRSGLSTLYPGMIKDSHLFCPYGYSMNAILYKSYFTLHVTPQPEGSYVSFETNLTRKDYSDLVHRVISIFKPGRFSLVLTTSMDPICSRAQDIFGQTIEGYWISDKSRNEFNGGYAMTLLNYKSSSGPG